MASPDVQEEANIPPILPDCCAFKQAGDQPVQVYQEWRIPIGLAQADTANPDDLLAVIQQADDAIDTHCIGCDGFAQCGPRSGYVIYQNTNPAIKIERYVRASVTINTGVFVIQADMAPVSEIQVTQSEAPIPDTETDVTRKLNDPGRFSQVHVVQKEEKVDFTYVHPSMQEPGKSDAGHPAHDPIPPLLKNSTRRLHKKIRNTLTRLSMLI